MTNAFAWPGRADAEPIDAEQARHFASRLHALADPARVRIVSLCAAKDGVPITVSELKTTLGLAQSTVSHHVRLLVDAGYLTPERSGTWTMYRVAEEALAALASAIAPNAS